MFHSLFLACMAYACGFLAMICHWHGQFPGLTMLPTLDISWITMVIVGLLSLFFLVGSHVSLGWVDLLVSGSPGWTNALEAL